MELAFIFLAVLLFGIFIWVGYSRSKRSTRNKADRPQHEKMEGKTP
jgi:hypothetical protein